MTTTTPQREGAKPSLAPVLPTLPSKSSALAEKRRAILYRAQGGRCWYCDCAMLLHLPAGAPSHAPPRDYATIEHITPLLRSQKKCGPFLKSEDNLVMACWQCNMNRGTLPLTTFIAKLREGGMQRGIVSRIRRLVNDHFPTPKRASEFEWYMLQALAHPRRPGDTLKRLPADLEEVTLPDPTTPIPLEVMRAKYPPQPKRRTPLLQRVYGWFYRRCYNRLAYYRMHLVRLRRHYLNV